VTACAGECVRLVTTTAERGLAVTEASRRGSRRSPARRHGRRRARRPRSVHEGARGFTAVAGRAQGGQGQGAYFLPLRDSTRGSRPWRGRGGANRSNAAVASYVRGKGPRLNLAPGIDTCACWGARWHGASGLRGDARECKRERERDRLGTHGGQRRHGKARPRERRALTKAAAPATYCPSLARRPTSPAAARWRGATARSTSARRPGHPHGEGSGCPHLGGHGPKCRRWCSVVVRLAGEEEEEEGGGTTSRRKGK
jgi:hypothetical protein